MKKSLFNNKKLTEETDFFTQDWRFCNSYVKILLTDKLIPEYEHALTIVFHIGIRFLDFLCEKKYTSNKKKLQELFFFHIGLAFLQFLCKNVRFKIKNFQGKQIFHTRMPVSSILCEKPAAHPEKIFKLFSLFLLTETNISCYYSQ